MRSGECFGEMALLLDRPRAATVRAVTPCDLLVLDREDFRRILADHPQAEADLLAVAARRG
jgi:CRP-like cAMP-binding protein